MSSGIPIEVHHRGDAMSVVAQLPGVRIEDLHIALTRDALTIEAQSAEGKRAFSLPLAAPVDERRATMRFAGGVLSLYLPTLPR